MSESYEFSQLHDAARQAALDVLSRALEGKKYQTNKTKDYVEGINSSLIDKLTALSANFKYIVTSTMVQKVGAGIHFESVSHWDPRTDGALSVKYENDSLICICSVFGVAI